MEFINMHLLSALCLSYAIWKVVHTGEMALACSPTAGLPRSYHGDGGGKKQQVLIIRDGALYCVGYKQQK